ncbi:MAG: GNAT family N-acetyltransferase [Rubrivivax sp.]|jgi:ribosomal protein S18 acetylase RimI-like enzyme
MNPDHPHLSDLHRALGLADDADQPAAPAVCDARPVQALAWVPVRALSERHRGRVLAHLLALPAADRYLRFGYSANDTQIAVYVDRLDFEHDEVFGIFNHRLEVVALAHLAYLPLPAGQHQASAEFGVSVAAHCRGRGWGARLFERAVLHARNRQVQQLVIHALADNAAMLRIVRRAGAQVRFDGADAQAHLTLPPENLVSHLEALMERQAAEFDYGVKLHVRRVDAWLQFLTNPTGALAPRHDHIPSLRERTPLGSTQPRDPALPPAV